MTYIFSNGDVADGSHVNDNFNKLNKLTNEKAINDVSATNSGVLAGSSQVLIDKFLDSTGQNNTVNTENTTGYYVSTNKNYQCRYINNTVPLISEYGFETVTSWTYQETDADFTGGQDSSWKTEGTYSYKLGVGGAITGSTYARVYKTVDFTNIDLLIIDFKNGAFNSNNTIKVNNVEIGNIPSGISYHNVYDVSAYSGNLVLEFKLLANNSSVSSEYTYLYIDNIRAVNLSDPNYSDSIVQSVATTIPTGMTKVFITPLMYEALATGDSITADVSIDNGAHYTTGVPINTWTPITSANGTQLIVKANLLTGSGVSTPKISGWRVLME